jgi:CheY-like chemotaxis protein
MARQTVTRYTASSQPHPLLAGMPRAELARRAAQFTEPASGSDPVTGGSARITVPQTHDARSSGLAGPSGPVVRPADGERHILQLPMAGATQARRRVAVAGKFRLPAMRPVPRVRHPELVIMRCLLVDDNTTFLETARSLLGRDGVTVAGTASCIAEAVRQASALRPDFAVVDIGLGAESGFDLARDLASRGITVIMTSTSAEADYADVIAENPVAGFLAKAELSVAGIRRILGSADGRDPRPA